MLKLISHPADKQKSKTTSGRMRLAKDVNELQLANTLKVEFPDKDNLQDITLIIMPDEGLYRSGRFVFSIKVSDNYPFEAPKVKCTQKIYHPNIDYEGNVCLNILREDWKPVLTLNAIIYGLQFLFLEPNAEDPLNKEAADLMARNFNLFSSYVHDSMRGRSINGMKYDRVVS